MPPICNAVWPWFQLERIGGTLTPEQIMEMDFRKHSHKVDINDVKVGDLLLLGSWSFRIENARLVRVVKVTAKTIVFTYLYHRGELLLRCFQHVQDCYSYYTVAIDKLLVNKKDGDIRKSKSQLSKMFFWKVEIDTKRPFFVYSDYLDYGH